VYGGAVTEPRPLRELVPFELAAVIAVAIVPLPEQLPAVVPLVVAAMVSRRLRRRPWSEVMHGDRTYALVGAAAGAAALVLAIVIGTPAIEAAIDRAVEWSRYAIVRGEVQGLVVVALFATAVAFVSELVLRGWIVERLLELAPAQRVLAILVGAFAEALVEPGSFAARIGAAIWGIGLGWIYVAGGRSVIAPACARLAFQLGAMILEAVRVIG
jgi:hypothetical protein